MFECCVVLRLTMCHLCVTVTKEFVYVNIYLRVCACARVRVCACARVRVCACARVCVCA